MIARNWNLQRNRMMLGMVMLPNEGRMCKSVHKTRNCIERDYEKSTASQNMLPIPKSLFLGEGF